MLVKRGHLDFSAANMVILMALYALVKASSQDSITVFGGWSPWTKLQTDCVKLNDSSGEIIDSSVNCGGGVKRQTRSCTNPKPQVKSMLGFITKTDLI